MCPGCDIALAMLEAAPQQPGRHSLAALVDDTARTSLMPGAEPDEPEDEQPLYAARKKVYPQRVMGTYRRVKWAVLVVTLGIYYLLPFVRWDRGPNAPSQAILIDFPNRRFYFFFIEIWPQEFYYLTGLLIIAAMALFLMNAVAGRLWCGYLCPQTVWTDLFQTIERWNKAFSLADDRLVDRRGLGALLRRRADAGERPRDFSGAAHRLYVHRSVDVHDLRTCRLDA